MLGHGPSVSQRFWVSILALLLLIGFEQALALMTWVVFVPSPSQPRSEGLGRIVLIPADLLPWA